MVENTKLMAVGESGTGIGRFISFLHPLLIFFFFVCLVAWFDFAMCFNISSHQEMESIVPLREPRLACVACFGKQNMEEMVCPFLTYE
jgi:hypothetical protein